MLFSTHLTLTALVAYCILFYGIQAAPGPITSSSNPAAAEPAPYMIPRAEPPPLVPTTRSECLEAAMKECDAAGPDHSGDCKDAVAASSVCDAFP
ncbi:hypothetical protein FRC12_004085 [Ceratobasidium sp. 428]|nr:hypothetical protein FRC12_004085 [Ceratobasidium sp. 428]